MSPAHRPPGAKSPGNQKRSIRRAQSVRRERIASPRKELNMHPGFIHWWKASRHGDCRQHACGSHDHHHHHFGGGHFGGGHFGGGHFGGGHGEGGAGFGVRRPLRFLAWKLELEEPQVAKLAAIIETLKTERAQADVDYRRSTAAIAAALESATLDPQALDDASKQRVESEQRRQRAVTAALTAIHELLDPDQRQRLAYLVRTGALQL